MICFSGEEETQKKFVVYFRCRHQETTPIQCDVRKIRKEEKTNGG